MTQFAVQAAKIIAERAPGFKPTFAMILGSGLGELVELLEDKIKIPYSDLPEFPPCGVAGHAGNLYLGKLNGTLVVFLQGRAHFYEGVSYSVAKTYIRALKLLGCQSILITNAAGSMRENIVPGDLTLITDHINFQSKFVLSGPNEDEFGPRFLGMEDVYNSELRQQLLATADSLNISLKQGIYFAVHGPHFETPAEIRCFQIMGGDVIAMSAISEVMIAHHCGMRVAMISVVSNMAAGLSTQKISHELTLSGVKLATEKLKRLVEAYVK